MGLAFTTDGGAAADAGIGLIVLQSDETLEAELRGVFTLPGVALYHTRIASAPEVTRETLLRMEADLPMVAGLLPKPLQVVGYACTSGATVIGQDRVAAAIRTVHPGVKVTDPITAVMAAAAHLKTRRLGFVTPYVAEVSGAMRALLTENGLEIAAFGSFEQQNEAVVARISEASVFEAICAIGAADGVEAVFASCTNLRSFGIIKAAETALGKPVITSNQALAWHLLRCAGVSAADGPGRLFDR